MLKTLEPLRAACAFDDLLAQRGLPPLSRRAVEILQINVGRYCNQACAHCHVEAGPLRTERMTLDTAQRILELAADSSALHTLDLTGGAPELHEVFRPLVEGARRLGMQVIDRCNLTVLFEPGQEHLAQYLADNQVQVVASLPCYSRVNVDKQRGNGVFDLSIRALQRLNELGYGIPGSGLDLDLVFNPQGVSLPPPQAALELEYKQHLAEDFGIRFNRLFAITNMPIKRFREQLRRENRESQYMGKLAAAFNPETVPNVMCRNLLSVSWDGRIYDCDFNQMLDLPEGGGATVWTIDSLDEFSGSKITTGDHCLGCTAGCGSSCGGSLA
ncbi:MAG: arsenosugar biosynthesis radical SAM protein ArsS [Holophagaceae bacterium]|nr:arsenosugar biosynthesis radical SAM protein ArsS [Holophagaceae bacterium]